MDEKRHFGHSALEASHRAKVIMGRTVSGDILDLIDDAWAAPTRDERARLARSALKLDADALDGYLALSTSVETTIEQFALLREAVRRGDALWSDAAKHPEEGFFWYCLDTRPWMRSMHALAVALWDNDGRSEAADLVDKLVRLQPSDSLGARYIGLSWHATLGNWAKVEKILRSCAKGDDGSTDFLWPRLLNEFRLGRDAKSALADAMDSDPHVPGRLLDERSAVVDSEWVSLGSPEEAISYAVYGKEAWASVPGALGWLKTVVPDAGPKPKGRSRRGTRDA